jgi:hypothetical protein
LDSTSSGDSIMNDDTQDAWEFAAPEADDQAHPNRIIRKLGHLLTNSLMWIVIGIGTVCALSFSW